MPRPARRRCRRWYIIALWVVNTFVVVLIVLLVLLVLHVLPNASSVCVSHLTLEFAQRKHLARLADRDPSELQLHGYRLFQ
jgi:hypothetical protein